MCVSHVVIETKKELEGAPEPPEEEYPHEETAPIASSAAKA